MIARIDHLNIVVSNLEEATAFFRLLGFAEGISAPLNAAFLEQVTGLAGAQGRFVALHHPASNVAIELLQFAAGGGADPTLGRADRIGLRHLAFAVDDIAATVAALRAHGITFLSEIQTWQQTGKQLVYFYGPDGILLELAQYPRG
jgi:catechol 2,3-dioxygenase-like lactoylglutathione lyase family enzyme